MPEYPRSPFEKTGTSITPSVEGDALDATIIGETTPAAGSFTTLTSTTNKLDATAPPTVNDDTDLGYVVGSRWVDVTNDKEYVCLDNTDGAAVWTETTGGGYELATDAETVTGTATDKVTTPANITAKMAAPGAIGGTTPATGVFTTLEATGQLQGALINNQMVQKATFDILGLMTDPRFLNLQCEDPGAGTMTDVSGQGHNGTYQGSMTSGDRIVKGMGWSIDFDGTDDYVNLGDHNDLSFGDSTNDEAVTFFGVLEILNGAARTIISKWDPTTGTPLREFYIRITAANKLLLNQLDESVVKGGYRETDAAIPTGWYSWVITSPGDGGATAMNNVKIYLNGLLVASTATNDASYVAMENLSCSCYIGAQKGTDGVPASFNDGDQTLIGIDGSEWSAYDVHRFHQLCKGLYGI